MVKKIRFQEIRASRRQRRADPRAAWTLEPIDGALMGASLIALLWLQWIAAGS